MTPHDPHITYFPMRFDESRSAPNQVNGQRKGYKLNSPVYVEFRSVDLRTLTERPVQDRDSMEFIKKTRARPPREISNFKLGDHGMASRRCTIRSWSDQCVGRESGTLQD